VPKVPEKVLPRWPGAMSVIRQVAGRSDPEIFFVSPSLQCTSGQFQQGAGVIVKAPEE
jgi:hypothetical protein